MLEFHSDCGFDSEEELIDYLEAQRDLALLSDDDDVVSSFEQDLSASYAEITDSIDGASLYVEYVSPEPLNEVKKGPGYSVEATIVSPEIVFWDPHYINEDEVWDEYFDSLKNEDFFAHGSDILLNSGLDPAANPILSSLNYSNEDYCLQNETWLSTISVGLAKQGLNMSETDLSEDKWVFRLFGKISGIVSAESASEAKSKFAQVIQDSFTFIDSTYGTNKLSLHEFLDGQDKVTIDDDWLWLIPIEHVFVNIRKQQIQSN
jgi:hypothetical protein